MQVARYFDTTWSCFCAKTCRLSQTLDIVASRWSRPSLAQSMDAASDNRAAVDLRPRLSTDCAFFHRSIGGLAFCIVHFRELPLPEVDFFASASEVQGFELIGIPLIALHTSRINSALIVSRSGEPNTTSPGFFVPLARRIMRTIEVRATISRKSGCSLPIRRCLFIVRIPLGSRIRWTMRDIRQTGKCC